LFALSNKVYVRHTLVLTVPLPERVMTLLNELRSSGRMFWPVAYALLAGAVLVLDRLPRRAVAATILTAALLLQVVDTSVLRGRLRTAYHPDPTLRPTFDATAFQPGGALVGRNACDTELPLSRVRPRDGSPGGIGGGAERWRRRGCPRCADGSRPLPTCRDRACVGRTTYAAPTRPAVHAERATRPAAARAAHCNVQRGPGGIPL
jgi:hypothetical protein